MNFAEWEPVYAAILADFGYSRAADEHARDFVATRMQAFDTDRLCVAGETVAIAGAAPSLPDELEAVRAADAVFAASAAADVLLDAGIDVDCMTTDLDKTPATAQALTLEGTPVAIHAHGDNIPALHTHLSGFDRRHVLATTQAAPVGPVRNFGGFTDGDRAAFLADHLGAAALVFPGWTVDDPTVGPQKRRKLVWAERLLWWLESRRGERFGVLDGRRARIDTTALPL